jgi:hypothetical protein
METVGSLIDKLSINELKIYHMLEQRARDDVSPDFIDDCDFRLSVLQKQKQDMIEELDGLLTDVRSGKRELKLYRQMKMYNEKKFKD